MTKPNILLSAICCTLILCTATAIADTCPKQGIHVQVLGSGGPEIEDQRAQSSYLVWQDGRSRVLIDAGSGSALRFAEAGADFAQLEAIALSHLHSDHSADLVAYIKSSFFGPRDRDLVLFGPVGNEIMSSTEELLDALFSGKGAYRYLRPYVQPDLRSRYKLRPQMLALDEHEMRVVYEADGLKLTATPAEHALVPALAWQVELDGRRIVFSGDNNGQNGQLEKLAAGADLLVAHNAVPETAQGVEVRLHMPPSVIGRIAGEAKVKNLLLSHRMRRTLGRETETETEIRANYSGPLQFADDLDCVTITAVPEG